MAFGDSAYLLSEVKTLTRVPTSTNFPTDAQWYSWMTQAENELKQAIAARFPKALLGAPVLMTSADSGQTYSFGTDAATNPIFALGSVTIYPSLNAIPSQPLIAGLDYQWETTKIRFPNNVPRTFAAGPYAQFVLPTYTIDGSTASTLPVPFRLALIPLTAATYAISGGQQDPTPYLRKYEHFLQTSIYPTLAHQYRNQGAIGAIRQPQAAPFPIRGA